MEKLYASQFKSHIKSKESQSKLERATFLYGNYTFDCALPQNWVDSTAKLIPSVSQIEIVSGFVWLYLGKDNIGQPAPLTLTACDILQALELVDTH